MVARDRSVDPAVLGAGADAGADELPDARDGLTRLERAILWQLRLTELERGGAAVPTAMLYGRVVEHVDVSLADFQAALTRLVGR